MRIARLQKLTLAAGCAVFLPLATTAQETAKPVFAAPERVHAGEAFLGAGRLYPSPVFHDVNGDGRLDLVIGDLIGKVTVAHGIASKKGLRFGPEEPLNGSNGKQLKFHNW